VLAVTNGQCRASRMP